MIAEPDPLAAELAALAKNDQDKTEDREAVLHETALLVLYYNELRTGGLAVDEAKRLTRRYQSARWGWTPSPDE